MTKEEELEIVASLRQHGYAVSIFTPEEIKEGVKPHNVEDAMVQAGWEAIG